MVETTAGTPSARTGRWARRGTITGLAAGGLGGLIVGLITYAPTALAAGAILAVLGGVLFGAAAAAAALASTPRRPGAPSAVCRTIGTGALTGTLIGSILGTVLAPVYGTIVGAFFGVLAGAWFGLMNLPATLLARRIRAPRTGAALLCAVTCAGCGALFPGALLDSPAWIAWWAGSCGLLGAILGPLVVGRRVDDQHVGR